MLALVREQETAAVNNDNDQEERRSGQDRRVSEDDTLVGHARAADGALAFLKSWIGVAVVLIGLGFEIERVVGKIDAAETASNQRFAAIEKSVDDFKAEVRDKLKTTSTDASSANNDARELRGEMQAAQRDIEQIKKDVAENFKIMMTYETKHK